MTMHKSQALGFPLLAIDSHGIFTFGQFYAALSRAETLDGLTLVNFKPEHVICSSVALEYYDAIPDIVLPETDLDHGDDV